MRRALSDASRNCTSSRMRGLAGKREQAIANWQEALERYDRKEIVPLAARLRERLATLQPA